MSSRYEEALANQIELRGRTALTAPVRQFRFAMDWGREYRVDFAWPEHRLAVEVDGGAFIGRGGRGAVVSRTLPAGYHQTIEDYRKRNLLNMLGWTLLAFQPEQVQKGEALAEIELALLRPEFGDYHETKWGAMLQEHVDRLAADDKLRRRMREARAGVRARARSATARRP